MASPPFSPADRTPHSPTHKPRKATAHDHHYSIISLSSISSKDSSCASSRYPSGLTALTSFSSETPSVCVVPSPSRSIPVAGRHRQSDHSPRYHHHHHHHSHSAGGQLSEDQFDIVDTLEYDDADEGMIDHELLHRNREAFVQQLYQSEHAYLESLELIRTVFLEPLRGGSKRSHFAFLGSKKPICTERELGWLFGNFEQVLQVQREILASLEQRLDIWGPTQIISDVITKWHPSLHVYKDYLNKYSTAVTTYQRLTNYQPFKKFIDTAHKTSALKGATLLTLLQIPAGSIGRYVDHVSKLADVTSPMHPDHFGLRDCKQRALRFLEEMKPRIREADNIDQVLMIQQAMAGVPFGVSAKRRLVLQGQLSRVIQNSNSLGEEQTYFLFSDMLVFVKPKQEKGKTLLQYKGHINLEQARVRAPDACETKGKEHCIEIISSMQGVDTLNTTYMGARQVYMLHANSVEEQQQWVKRLGEVIADLDREAARTRKARRMAHARPFMEDASDKRLSKSSSTQSSASADPHSSSAAHPSILGSHS